MSHASASAVRSSTSWQRLGGIAALLLYALGLAYYYAPIAAGSDAAGYLNNARILTEGKLTLTARTTPELGSYPWHHFVPLGYWSLEGETHLRPTYAFGVPLQQAIAAKLAGWFWGPLLAGVACAIAAVALTYLCARELAVAPLLAMICAAALAVSPIFVSCSLQPMSDGPSVTWCVAAFYAGLRARRGFAAWSIACGAACAMAVLVRASNILLVPALVVLLWNGRLLLGAALGGLPGAVALGVCQHVLYGSALRSGYGNFYSTMDALFFPEGVWHFGKWLFRFSPLVFAPVPLAFAFRRSTRRRETIAVALWLAAFLLFYACYPVAKDEAWWGLRFIVPAIPAALLLAGLALELFARTWPEQRRGKARLATACVAFAIAVLPAGYWIAKLRILHVREAQDSFAAAPAWAAALLPRESIIACMELSGALYFYSDFPVLRWDQIPLADFKKYVASLRKTGRPLYAMVYPWEEEAMAQRGEMAVGSWKKFGEVESVRILKLAE